MTTDEPAVQWWQQAIPEFASTALRRTQEALAASQADLTRAEQQNEHLRGDFTRTRRERDDLRQQLTRAEQDLAEEREKTAELAKELAAVSYRLGRAKNHEDCAWRKASARIAVERDQARHERDLLAAQLDAALIELDAQTRPEGERS